MEFFDREYEIGRLREYRERSRTVSQFTVLTGRRRIGKTALLLKAYADEPFLYLFVARKTEADLCHDFSEEIARFFDCTVPGRVDSFASLFRFLMEKGKDRSYTLVIDEFQDFYRVNPSVFSEIQRDWDLMKDKAKVNFVVSGSVNTLMNKIFRDAKEPLYGRQTAQMKLRPFPPSVLKSVLRRYSAGFKGDDLLALWMLTGGVAKYVALLMDAKAFTVRKMLSAVVEEDSFFVDEGFSVLSDEFGKDYGTYFSILAAIARGKTSRSEIKNEIGGEVSGYLTRLESQYGIISKRQPIFERTKNKGCLYSINDGFFRFWFRFIYRHRNLVELGAFNILKEIVQRDYEVCSGAALEELFKAKLAEERKWTRIGSWWDRRGEAEIDIVAEDEIEKKAMFVEVKRDAKRISIPMLREKAEVFMRTTGRFAGYDVSCKGFSLNDL